MLQYGLIMLVLRNAQMRVLAEASFYSCLESEMKTLFPVHCQALGAGLRNMIRSAADRARSFGFDSREVAGYTALEFAFGPEFTSRTEYAWAARILADPGIPTSRQRMSRLREAAVFYLARLAEQEPRVHTAEESNV